MPHFPPKQQQQHAIPLFESHSHSNIVFNISPKELNEIKHQICNKRLCSFEAIKQRSIGP